MRYADLSPTDSMPCLILKGLYSKTSRSTLHKKSLMHLAIPNPHLSCLSSRPEANQSWVSTIRTMGLPLSTLISLNQPNSLRAFSERDHTESQRTASLIQRLFRSRKLARHAIARNHNASSSIVNALPMEGSVAPPASATVATTMSSMKTSVAWLVGRYA